MTTRFARTHIAAVAALLVVVSAPAVRAEVIEEIAAWVNGQIITRSQLVEREQSMTTQLSSRLVGDELDHELETMCNTLLTDMIREEILIQRAEFLGLELDRVFEQAVKQLKEQQGIKTNAEFDEVLREEGISQEELRDTLLRFNVPDIMVNLEVRDKIVVTDEEIEDFYGKHKHELRSEEEFTVREIVLMGKDRTDDELKQLGETVSAELAAGTSFNELVVKYSEAPSRFKDGLMGPLKRGDLMREIEDAALALEVGEVSRPIPTAAGLHIVKLDSHTEASEHDLEESRPTITSRIKRKKFVKALREYFEMLMESNRIQVNPVYAKFNQTSS